MQQYNIDNIETKNILLKYYLRTLCYARKADWYDRGHVIKSTFTAILIYLHYYGRELFISSRLISAASSY